MLWLVTATGGRQAAFDRLIRYVNGQTYDGPIRWIVVDDCDPATTIPPIRDGIKIEVIRPEWRWRPGQNTQSACLSAALAKIPKKASCVILEDDDVYLPRHLSLMMDALKSAELVGQRTSYYYNIRTRRYRELPGVSHASLSATAMRGVAIDLLRDICAHQNERLDMTLWNRFAGSKTLLDARTCIGIKGLPGRPGIGVGHRADFGSRDLSGAILSSWIGKELAAAYL